jgi:hypothetical protein|tara:strand:- start:6495 stop:6932 length:438 start_codon:yes stop_codon:yes gene_type:complete
MPPPAWLVPALIAAGTAVSYYGSLQQSRNLRRATETDKVFAQDAARKLGIEAAKQGRKKLSLIRALQSASGTAATGSNLLQRVETVKEIENAQYFASKNLAVELGQISARGSLSLAQEAQSRSTNLLGGGFQFYQAGVDSGLFKV